MVPKTTTILRRVLVGALTLSLLTAFVATPANADHRTGWDVQWFSGTYGGGASYMAPVPVSAPDNPTGVSEPVFGVMACGSDNQRVPFDNGAPDGAGGTCPPVYVQDGDQLFLFACNGPNGSADLETLEIRDCSDVSFGACIDGDEDGLCRPEHPADSIYFHTCNRNNHGDGSGDDRNGTMEWSVYGGGLITTHDGPPGPLALFVMQDPTNADDDNNCSATEGDIWGSVAHEYVIELHACQDGQDNDGNGLIDWPADPGCDSPEDDLEAVPDCRDGLDNDNDGLIDYPDDPGCSGPDDWSEPNPYVH